MKRIYNWKPDVPDHRDITYKLRSSAADLPDKVYPLDINNPIEDQGPLGCCTGFAATAMLETVFSQDAGIQLSQLMAYYNARVIENTVNEDSGAQIRNVIKGLMKKGSCSLDKWPYDPSTFNVKPDRKKNIDAKKVIKTIEAQKLKYSRIDNLQDMLRALANGGTVTFGFMVPESFERLGAKQVLKLPKKKEAMLGGHAVLAVGYNIPDKYIIVRNSWGEKWCDNGRFKMSFDWFTDPRRLADDMWTLHR